MSPLNDIDVHTLLRGSHHTTLSAQYGRDYRLSTNKQRQEAHFEVKVNNVGIILGL